MAYVRASVIRDLRLGYCDNGTNSTETRGKLVHVWNQVLTLVPPLVTLSVAVAGRFDADPNLMRQRNRLYGLSVNRNSK